MAENLVVGIIFNAYDKTLGAFDGITGSIDGLKKSLATIKAPTQAADEALGKLSNWGSSLTKKITLPLAALAVGASALGAESDTLKRSLTLFTGSMEATESVLASLGKMRLKMPFSDEDLKKSELSLLRLGLSTTDSIKFLQTLGNIGAGTDKTLLQMVESMAILTQQATVSYRQLKTLGAEGVPVIDFLSKKYGKTKAQLEEIAQAGGISTNLLLKSLKEMANKGGVFFTAMGEKNKEFIAGLLRLKDVAVDLIVAIADVVKKSFPISSNTVEHFVDILVFLKDALIDLQKTHPELVKWGIRLIAASAAAGPVMTLLSKIGSYFPSIKTILGTIIGLTIGLGALGVILSMIGVSISAVVIGALKVVGGILLFIFGKLILIGAVILAVVGSVNLIVKYWKEINMWVGKAWEKWKDMTNFISPASNDFPELHQSNINMGRREVIGAFGKNTTDIALKILLPDGVDYEIPYKKTSGGGRINVFAESLLGPNFDIAIPYRR